MIFKGTITEEISSKNILFESCASWTNQLQRMSQNNGDYLREYKYLRFAENLTRNLFTKKIFFFYAEQQVKNICHVCLV